jgi:hypothetical protein
MLARPENRVCSACGQQLLVRRCVTLPPSPADLLDMIEHAGKRDVGREVLGWFFWPNKPKRAAERCISTNINRLDEFLEAKDVCVRATGRFEPYRVRRRRSRP